MTYHFFVICLTELAHRGLAHRLFSVVIVTKSDFADASVIIDF